MHLSLYDDETSALCHWQIPEAHFLEAWSDARGYDGTVSIVQPLIAPLYGGKSAHELLAAMSDRPERSALRHRARVLEQRRAASPTRVDRPVAATPTFDASTWRRWLHDGVMPDTAFAGARPSPSSRLRRRRGSGADRRSGLEIVFRNDPAVLDGRFANNGWLQELPKPITKLTWDNAVLVSPATAARLQLGDRAGGRRAASTARSSATSSSCAIAAARFAAPLFPVAGHPDDCVTVHLGYGRTRAGHVGTGAGFNANALRTSDALWFGRGARDRRRPARRYSLACTQYHHLMEGRGMIRAVTRDEFVRDPKLVHEGYEAPPRTLTLYPDFKYEGYKWGMAIDVNACIGCNACVVGCQAENNIPVVGKDQVLRGREMHWMRVDTLLSRAAPTTRRPTSSRCRACTARTRRARSSARSARPCTATKG